LSMSLVVMAAIGITFAQYVNAQNQNSVYNQTPRGNYGNLPPNFGNGYSQVPQQGAHPYRMGMCGRYW
jgi:hypothetical protein